MRVFITIFFIIIFANHCCNAQEMLYILNDNCIINLYSAAEELLQDNFIFIIKDPHGIILRFELKNPELEVEKLSQNTCKKIYQIRQFLAKINKPAIIEVHINEISSEGSNKLKKWEISTLIANKIESLLLNSDEKLDRNKISSVGYGEFLPPKNTSNNGGNYINRVDIMILCDVYGE